MALRSTLPGKMPFVRITDTVVCVVKDAINLPSFVAEHDFFFQKKRKLVKIIIIIISDFRMCFREFHFVLASNLRTYY